METSITNGLSKGSFDQLHVFHNGEMQDITTLLGSGGGGSGGGSVTSVVTPLNLNEGQLSIGATADRALETDSNGAIVASTIQKRN